MTAPPSCLSSEIVEEIQAFFPRYPDRRAALLPALHVIHERMGYVPSEAVVDLARLLQLAPAEVQDTLSFYGFFPQEPPQGRLRVWVCRSLSCAARGGEDLLAYLSRKLGIEPGQTTPDGRITLEFAECLGACDHAPGMLAGRTLYKNLTKEKIDQFLATIPEAPGPDEPAS